MSRTSLLTFAHQIVRDTAFADPLMLLWAAHKDDADARFQNILRRCVADASEDAAVDVDALHVGVVGDGPLYVALFTPPRARATAECFFVGVAVVVPDELTRAPAAADAPGRDPLERALSLLIGASTPEQRQAVALPVRVFTLEYAVDEDGAAGAAFCEWQKEPLPGLSDGPGALLFRRVPVGVAVDVDAAGFVDAVATACVTPFAQA